MEYNLINPCCLYFLFSFLKKAFVLIHSNINSLSFRHIRTRHSFLSIFLSLDPLMHVLVLLLLTERKFNVLSLPQMFFWFMANSVGFSIKICWHEPWRGKFCVAVKTMVHARVKVHLLVIRRGRETRTQIHWFLLATQPRVIYAGSDRFIMLFWNQMPICVYMYAPFFYCWAILVGTRC